MNRCKREATRRLPSSEEEKEEKFLAGLHLSLVSVPLVINVGIDSTPTSIICRYKCAARAMFCLCPVGRGGRDGSGEVR